MEGLVNYSSEDEQDEHGYKSAAVRGNPRKRRSSSSNSSSDSVRGQYQIKGGGSGNGNGGRNNYKEEESLSHKYKANTSSSSGGNRHYNRESVGGRDKQRDSRDKPDAKSSRNTTRDSREYGNGNRSDYKMNQRNKRESDNFRESNRRPPRDDERNYNSRQSAHSHHKDRHSNNNNSHYGGESSTSSSRRHHHNNRSREDRHERPELERSAGSVTDRHRRRGADSSRTPSPIAPAARHHHSKRSYRSRSPRSHSPRERASAINLPIEQARLSALAMERKLNVDDKPANLDTRPMPPARKIEALMSLPLSDTAPKQPNVIAVAPPIISAASYSASSSLIANAEPAVIQLPSYYNASVINPNKYAEQVQKRKLLWGAKKVEDNAAKWGHAQFSQDSDGKVASKFMRLMGIKGGAAATATGKSDAEGEKPPTAPTTVGAPDVKSREAMFTNMEQQYEVARQVTHTMRGVGLGFSSQSRQF